MKGSATSAGAPGIRRGGRGRRGASRGLAASRSGGTPGKPRASSRRLSFSHPSGLATRWDGRGGPRTTGVDVPSRPATDGPTPSRRRTDVRPHRSGLQGTRIMTSHRNRAFVGIAGIILGTLSTCAAEAGEWVSLFDGQTLSGWTQGGGKGTQQVGGRGRRHRRLGQAVDALQPQGRLQELQVPRRGQDQRPRQLGHVLPLPQAQRRASPKGYEAQIDSTHSDPIRTGSIYGFVHVYKQLVPPDTWFTYEVEVRRQELARQDRHAHQGHGQRRGALRVHRLRPRPGTRATSRSSSTTRAARSTIRKIEVMELDEHGK